MALRIKVGDSVLVRKGKDKGASGKVLKISADSQRVLVEGINIKAKHQKPNVKVNVDAGIYKEPRMMSIANVGHAHPSKKGITGRIGFESDKNGSKKRVFKANGKEIK